MVLTHKGINSLLLLQSGAGRHRVNEMATGKFEVYTDKKGEFRFRLKAANGEVIAVGEGYSTKAACMNGIESVKKNAPVAPVVEVNS